MAKISKLIDDLTGKTEEEAKLREQFTFLQKMARSKAETFENQLKIMLSNKEAMGQVEIVGDRAFEYRNSQHVNISNECNAAIGEAVDDFFKGSSGVKDGFQKIVKTALSGLIGDTSIGETQEKMFFVYPENYSIVRVDVMAYKYTFTSKGVLSKDVENIFVYTMAKSIVDHKKVGADFLVHCVVEMMKKPGQEEPPLDEVLAFITELRKCWELLDKFDTSPNTVLAARESDNETDALPSFVTPEMIEAKERFDEQYSAITSVDELLAV